MKAKKDRNIPLIIQPPQPAPEPIIEPVDLSVQPEVSANRKTKSKKVFIIALDLERIKILVKTLKGKTTEFLSEHSQKRYVGYAKILFRILNVDNLNTVLKNTEKTIKTVEDAEKIDGGKYSTNSKKGLVQLILVAISNGWLGEKDKKTLQQPYKDYYERLDFTSRETTKQPKEYDDIDEYVERIKQKFGGSSKQFLVAKLYQESTRRDDCK